MSANTYISIIEKKNHFSIVMKDADTGVSLGVPKRTKDLRVAIEMANKIQEKEEIEYGLRIDLLDKKQNEK